MILGVVLGIILAAMVIYAIVGAIVVVVSFFMEAVACFDIPGILFGGLSMIILIAVICDFINTVIGAFF